MTVIQVSERELNRLKVVVDLADGRISADAAAALMGVGRRQVFRLCQAFAASGPTGVISKQRGRPSNRKYGDSFRRTVTDLVRERYPDFGPTLAAEKLAELHGLQLGVETLRQWMIEDRIWLRRRDRLAQVHQPRNRRECFGELVQIDGSEHWWFEDRGPQCSLLVYIDDATSRLVALLFVRSETAFDYFKATRSYIETCGKPVAFYSDKHSIFRISKVGGIHGDGMTQFGRALHALNIDILCANTPQAKGRVERANKTLQDRLVKELRLQGISTMEAGNAMLPAFMADYNGRFAKDPKDARDMHRPLTSMDDVDMAFSWQEERTVSHSLTLQYDKILFLLEPTDFARGLIRKRVMVHDYPDGRLEIRCNGRSLPYSTFDKIRQVSQANVVENKSLSAALEFVRELQSERTMQRNTHAPVRRGQTGHMFKVG